MKAALFIGICLVLQTDCTTLSSSCLSLLHACISPHLCRSQKNLLRNVCVSEDSSCQNPGGCNATVQAIFTHLTECVCTDENPCSILQLLASFCQSYSDGDDRSRPTTQQPSSQASALHLPSDHHLPSPGHENNLRDEWKESRMLSSDISCIHGMTLCIQDEMCNRQLVPFVQSCSSPHCQDSLCRLAARQLYSNLPDTMTEMLVFCQCESDDHDCNHFQAMLNSNSCNNDQREQWNCLAMLDNCTGERICRRTFEVLLSKCFGVEEDSLSEYSTTELLHVIDLDFFVSGNKECTSAFVATMGTVLQSVCTCHGLDHHSLYRCNVLKQAIQNRSYFKPNPNNRSVTKSKDEESQQEYSWLSDRLLYVVVAACVLALVVVLAIAVVMHKLGKKHNRSKNLKLSYQPPENSPKSLVI